MSSTIKQYTGPAVPNEVSKPGYTTAAVAV